MGRRVGGKAALCHTAPPTSHERRLHGPARFNEKVAFITGACSGIGLATTELFIAQGARVLAADIQDDAGAALAAALRGPAQFAHCDVTQPAQIQAAVDRAAAEFGGLDIVFNNAGAGGPAWRHGGDDTRRLGHDGSTCCCCAR